MPTHCIIVLVVIPALPLPVILALITQTLLFRALLFLFLSVQTLLLLTLLNQTLLLLLFQQTLLISSFTSDHLREAFWGIIFPQRDDSLR